MQEGQDNTSSNISENMYCRVIGSVRVNQERRNVMVFRITQVSVSHKKYF